MKTSCPICGERLDPTRSRRPAKFCSAKCKQKAYRQRKMTSYPAEMREATRWVCADRKRPITTTGAPASSTAPGTWTDWASVKGKPHGFMLGGGFACIDLDDCFTGKQLQPWAKTILDAAPGAWAERSISGNGLHIFGLLPEAKGRRFGQAEIYSDKRFIRTTCNVHQPGELVPLRAAVKLIQRLAKAGVVPG